MNIVHAILAEICLKALGNSGPEGMALSGRIKSIWNPLADDFLDDMFSMAINLEEGCVNMTSAKKVLKNHREAMTDGFIEKVGDAVFNYSSLAYDFGVSKTAITIRDKVEKFSDSVIEELAILTSATKKNAARTVNRWFQETQGQYFDRFITTHMERVRMRVAEAGGPATLNKIGRTYKKFVQGNGYWDSVSDFNTASASIFGQVDALHELGYTHYMIVAQHDRLTCPVCQSIDGTEWTISSAQGKVAEMIILGAEESAAQFPWPRAGDDLGAKKGMPQLPPFHARCRCYLEVTLGSKGAARSIYNYRRDKNHFRGVSNKRLKKYMDFCVVAKALDKRCLSHQQYKITDMQIGYEGEFVIRDIFDIEGAFTRHKNPIDLLIPKGKIAAAGYAFEVKSTRSFTKVWKCRMDKDEIGRKIREVNRTKTKPGTFLLVRDEFGNFDIFYEKGHAAYRHTTMRWVGQAQRPGLGREVRTMFSEDVKENILRVIQGKGPRLHPGNVTTKEIEDYIKRLDLSTKASKRRIAQHMKACIVPGMKVAKITCLDAMGNKIDDMTMKSHAEDMLSNILKGSVKTSPSGVVDLVFPAKKFGKGKFAFDVHVIKPGGKIKISQSNVGDKFKFAKAKGHKPAMLVAVDDGKGYFDIYVKNKYKWEGKDALKFVGNTGSDASHTILNNIEEVIGATKPKVGGIGKPKVADFTAKPKVKTPMPPDPEPLPPEAPMPPASDLEEWAGRLFKEDEHQRLYERYLSEYVADVSLKSKISFKQRYADEISEYIRMQLDGWQGNTRNATTLKMKAMELEVGNLDVRRYEGYWRMSMENLHKISTDDYIKARAFNQAYFKKNNIEYVLLDRGVGGAHGRRFAEEVEEMVKMTHPPGVKPVYMIKEDALCGYTAKGNDTAKEFIDKAFGVRRGGLTLRRKVLSRDVWLSSDIWVKRVHIGEAEYIVIGGKRGIPIKQIMTQFSARRE